MKNTAAVSFVVFYLITQKPKIAQRHRFSAIFMYNLDEKKSNHIANLDLENVD